jgi:hypothetical protein
MWTSTSSQDFAIHRDGHRLGGVDDPIDVTSRDLDPTTRHRDHAVAVYRSDVIAGDTGKHVADFDPGHELRLFDRPPDRNHGLFQVDHHATAQSIRSAGAHTHDLGVEIAIQLGDYAADLGCSDVEPNDDVLACHHSSPARSRKTSSSSASFSNGVL